MAAADYRLCDVCGSKTFYDANLDYDFKEYPGTGLYNLGDWSVICRNCAKTHFTFIAMKLYGQVLHDEELVECFTSTNTREPLAEGWPGLERFARAVEAAVLKRVNGNG